MGGPISLQLKAASFYHLSRRLWLCCGIRKSHSCLIRIQCPGRQIAIWVFAFYSPPLQEATCHMPLEELPNSSPLIGWCGTNTILSLATIIEKLYSWQEADCDINPISLRAGGSQPTPVIQVVGTWLPPDSAVTLNQRHNHTETWIRGEPPNHDSHNLHLCRAHNQTKYLTSQYLNQFCFTIYNQEYSIMMPDLAPSHGLRSKDTTHFCDCLWCWLMLSHFVLITLSVRFIPLPWPLIGRLAPASVSDWLLSPHNEPHLLARNVPYHHHPSPLPRLNSEMEQQKHFEIRLSGVIQPAQSVVQIQIYTEW